MHSPRDTPLHIPDQDETGRRSWLLSLEFIIEAQRDEEVAGPLGDLENRIHGSIAAILRQRLPQLADDLTLAIALQALWRGWLLGTVTHHESDARRFARSIGWLISGATATGPRQPEQQPPRTGD